MKPQNLLRVILFLVLCVATFSSGSQVDAKGREQSATPPAVQIVIRGLSYWDAIYIGNVSSTRYENWPFTFAATYTFTITATTTSGDLVPLLILYDGNGNEISTTTNVLTSTQPAGSYSVQIQPFSGSGTYSLTIRQVAGTSTPTPAVPTSTPIFTNTPGPTSTPASTNTPITPVSTNTPVVTNTPVATDTPVVTNTPGSTNTPVSTNTPTATLVPSATPTLVVTATATPTSAYVTTVLTPSSIPVGGTSTGTVFLNNVPASGFASAEFTCTYDQTLISVSNIVATNLFGADPVMVVNGPQNGSFIVAIAGSNGNKATTSGAVFTFTVTGLQAGQSAVDCQAKVSTGNLILTTIPSNPTSVTVNSSSTPTPTTVPTIGTFSGQVIANKSVTVTLHNPDTTVAGSVVANVDGTFSLAVAGGTYTAIASAPGYLKAQGSFAIANGNTTTAQTVSLLAGDIDGNDVIDQFDALTIGINYNGAAPTAADLNNDGVINVLDMEILAESYRQAGALTWQ